MGNHCNVTCRQRCVSSNAMSVIRYIKSFTRCGCSEIFGTCVYEVYTQKASRMHRRWMLSMSTQWSVHTQPVVRMHVVHPKAQSNCTNPGTFATVRNTNARVGRLLLATVCTCRVPPRDGVFDGRTNAANGRCPPRHSYREEGCSHGSYVAPSHHTIPCRRL